MNRSDLSRRTFLRSSTASLAALPAMGALACNSTPRARAGAGDSPLFAYVGTFSSPLGDVPDTQVDLPPGNGRGIHIFRVDRTSGALSPVGVREMGTS